MGGVEVGGQGSGSRPRRPRSGCVLPCVLSAGGPSQRLCTRSGRGLGAAAPAETPPWTSRWPAAPSGKRRPGPHLRDAHPPAPPRVPVTEAGPRTHPAHPAAPHPQCPRAPPSRSFRPGAAQVDRFLLMQSVPELRLCVFRTHPSSRGQTVVND